MKKTVVLLLTGSAVFLMCGKAGANHLVITNVSLGHLTNGTAAITVDVSWSNSWRYTEMAGGSAITNHDAAWLFIKFRAGGDWHHARLTETGHIVPAGTDIKLGASGNSTNAGAFLLRSSDGYGGLVATGVGLRWDYVQAGLTGTNGVDISVHGMEMVYVPEGSFYLGSGGSEVGAFYQYPSPTTPFPVTNEDAITVGVDAGNLYYSSGGIQGDQGGPIPAAFPKGYAAFYCMKYEITQGQYAQFLNRVPSGSDWFYYPDHYNHYRHVLHLIDGVYTADAPDRACNYLSWSDVAGFLDWAGLRPMSEMEFEKACRGPLFPVPNEYAWGDTSLAIMSSLLGADGSGTETANPATANCHTSQSTGSPVYGPVRVGIFATSASTRHQAGAGYYGVMELSGNLIERLVSAGNAAGRAFIPTHGDGDTQTANPGWPSPATAVGVGRRGGSFAESQYPPTSARVWAAWTEPARSLLFGGRGVRSAE